MNVQQWRYEFDPDQPDAGVVDELTDLSYSKCDADYIESVHTDV